MFVQPQSCLYGNCAFPQAFAPNIPFGTPNFGSLPFGVTPWSNVPVGALPSAGMFGQSYTAALPAYHQRPSLFELSPWLNPIQTGIQNFVPPFFGSPFIPNQVAQPWFPMNNIPFNVLPQLPVNSQLNPLPFLSQQSAFVDPRMTQFSPVNTTSVGTSSTGVH